MASTPQSGTGSSGYIAFAVGPIKLAIPLDQVQQVLRLPELVPIPLGPPSLRGLARLRSMVLPVISLRQILQPDGSAADLTAADLSAADLPDQSDSERVLVIGHAGHPIGLLVERMEGLISTDQMQVTLAGGDAGSGDASDGESEAVIDATLISGTLRARIDDQPAGLATGMVPPTERIILATAALIDSQFADLWSVSSALQGMVGGAAGGLDDLALAGDDSTGKSNRAVSDDQDNDLRVVAFAVRGQDFALPVDAVREVIPLPDSITPVPRARSHLLGLTSLRDELLPLVDLAGLFRLDSLQPDNARVVVVRMPGRQGQEMVVGAVVDRVRDILAVPANRIDPVPPLMARNAEFEDVTGIARLDSGKRLIPLLSPTRLFQLGDVIRSGLATDQDGQNGGDGSMSADRSVRKTGDRQGGSWVLFQLGDAHYGLPVRAVQEVLRCPDQLVPLPKAPDFVRGMLNLRGAALPVIDLRRLMRLPEQTRRQDRQRIIVLTLGSAKVGLLADALDGIERIPENAIGAAPNVSAAQKRLIRKVAGLQQDGRRMILLMEPEELIDMDLLVELQPAC